MGIMEVQKGTLCAKSCGREADEYFGEDLNAMNIIHGEHGQPWCNHCILSRQLEYAEERANAIPNLKQRIIDLEFGEAKI